MRPTATSSNLGSLGLGRTPGVRVALLYEPGEERPCSVLHRSRSSVVTYTTAPPLSELIPSFITRADKFGRATSPVDTPFYAELRTKQQLGR